MQLTHTQPGLDCDCITVPGRSPLFVAVALAHSCSLYAHTSGGKSQYSLYVCFHFFYLDTET